MMNMNLFHIFCIICLGISCVLCNPVPTDTSKITFYDAVVQKCPAVAHDAKFREQIQSCEDWEKISKVESISDKKDILCFLYFNAFTEYCNHTEKPDFTIPNDVKTVDLETVCDNLIKAAKNSLHKIISTPEDCMKICAQDFHWVTPLCSISYYYNHKQLGLGKPHLIKVTKPAPEEQNAEAVKTKPENQVPIPKEEIGDVSVREQTPKAVKPNPGIVKPAEVNDKKKTEIPAHNPVNQENLHAVEVTPVVKYQMSSTQKDQVKPVPLNHGTSTEKDIVKPVLPNKSTSNTNQPPDASGSKPKPVTSKANESKPKSTSIEVNAQVPPVEPDDNNAVQEQPQFVVEDQDILPDEKNVPPYQPESEEEEMAPIVNEKSQKPSQTNEDSESVSYATEMDGDSYFFTYFMLLCVIFIVGYVCYHNKQKILALILEGRRGKRQFRGRRPNSANYHKLDSNLEEAISSSCNKNTSNVIY